MTLGSQVSVFSAESTHEAKVIDALVATSIQTLINKPAMTKLKQILNPRLIALAFAVMLSGCASIVSSDSQDLKVQILCGNRPILASCTAENSQGKWYFQTPGIVTVKNDNRKLALSCKPQSMSSFTVFAPALPSWGIAGNVLAGGVVGAAVDLYNNTGLKYPDNIDISSPYCN